MRNLLFIILFAGLTVYASAQKVYFVYLQSENSRPFYVKMGDKIYSSANSGYLILSNLVDSTYNFSLGFASSNAESRFVIALGGKDRGFLIKNLESGLSLFDLQNHTTINAKKEEAAKTISYQKRNDEFSFLLSKAANDTSLLYAVVRSKEDLAIQKEQSGTEESKQKPEESILLKDSATVSQQQADLIQETKKPDTTVTVQSITDIQKGNGVIAGSANEDLKKDTAALARQKEEQVVMGTDNSALDTAAKTDSLTVGSKEETTIFKKSQVRKHSESSTTEGFGLVFYDIYEGGQDTIRLLIPNPPIIFKQMSDADSAQEQKGFIHVEELKKRYSTASAGCSRSK